MMHAKLPRKSRHLREIRQWLSESCTFYRRQKAHKLMNGRIEIATKIPRINLIQKCDWHSRRTKLLTHTHIGATSKVAWKRFQQRSMEACHVRGS